MATTPKKSSKSAKSASSAKTSKKTSAAGPKSSKSSKSKASAKSPSRTKVSQTKTSSASKQTAKKTKPTDSKKTARRQTIGKTAKSARTTKATKTVKTAKTAKTASETKKKVSSSRRQKLKYKKGQEIVYPLQGVGQIVSIEERLFRGDTLLYYIIYLEVSDMTIMVPVDKADQLGIRPIVDRRQANKALRLISEEYEPVPTDWKARYQNNLDLLKKGSVLDVATVVRALFHRSKIKELPILERKLYDSALKLLVDEISFSLQKNKEEVEDLVISKMEMN